MEIESVFIDEWGKFGVISKDKRQYWINSGKFHTMYSSYNSIECEDNTVILKLKDNRKTIIFSNAFKYFQPSWMSGQVLKDDMPRIKVFHYDGNSIIIGKNGDCYETESGCTYAFADDDLYKIDSHTGKKLSDKIAPSFTQSAIIGRIIQTAPIDHYEMNSLGLLQIDANMCTIYSELDVGEVVERVSKNIIASSQNIHYIEILSGGSLFKCEIQKDSSMQYSDILKTFYGQHKGHSWYMPCFKINGATVTKHNGRIEVTGLKTGSKTKAASRELTD